MSLLISGEIRTRHKSPESVAEALSADNLLSMRTVPDGVYVKSTIEGNKLRSVVASVDDYLMNLSVAEDICRCIFSVQESSRK
ncbi:KEOPS complex subunit Pcc1 [Methanoplanus endosymbiosus]|uniref:KEOPS complex subunit Pcc1 n=1 Tax=Methanoplanus endosymbiosus TaxID=33865 RepID=A0A9E7PKX2_9EURY|nr:KEOPS complex subunit Pcc1 [Methanoplanus endosymbiosus]UUX91795.1 hypothetical protein L6E24_10530 [Methanoplanus endosymbiosus]